MDYTTFEGDCRIEIYSPVSEQDRCTIHFSGKVEGKQTDMFISVPKQAILKGSAPLMRDVILDIIMRAVTEHGKADPCSHSGEVSNEEA